MDSHHCPQIMKRVTESDWVKQTSKGPYSRAFCIPNVKLGTRAESLTTLEKTAVGVSSFTLRK